MGLAGIEETILIYPTERGRPKARRMLTETTPHDPHERSTSTRGRLCVDTSCATMSHMEVGVRDLRNRTSHVIDAVRAGERVTLTVHGEPVADIVPHRRRARWLSGERLRNELAERSADAPLTEELDDLAGQTLDDL